MTAGIRAGWPARTASAAAVAVALAAFVPFARGLLAGESFFFRDLSRYHFPVRRFVVEGLASGELRYWNPLLHEGEPLPYPPVSYPLELLHLLAPSEWGFSLLLALHIPLAGLAFMALARGMGLGPAAAAGGSLAYCLGGFALSCINLYEYVYALAWTPLVVLALMRAAERGGGAVVLGAAATAVLLSTGRLEIAFQALLFGLVLSVAPARRLCGGLRVGASVILGAGLAGPTLLVILSPIATSARSPGLPTKMVLADSLHPVRFVQVAYSGLFGDPSQLVDRFWGGRFFADFPYFLSFYLGLGVLSVALVGARHGIGPRARLLAWAAAAVVVCLGRYAGIEALVEATPLLRVARYPSKAFFSVHLAVALLVSLGLDRMARGPRRAWVWLAWGSLGVGTLSILSPMLPALSPRLAEWAMDGFFPPGLPWEARYDATRFVLQDACLGGLVTGAVGLLALLVLRGRLSAARAVPAVVALLGADLVRAGAGLNPTVSPSFYEPSPETSSVAAAVHRTGGRVFSCDPELDPAFWEAKQGMRGSFEVWTFAVLAETLTPGFNMTRGVPSAYSRDLTMGVPVDRVLAPKDAGCASFAGISERLWRAGVAHVLSLHPIEDPRLRAGSVAHPRRIAPAAVFYHSVVEPLPLRVVARQVRPVAGLAATVGPGPDFQRAGGTAVEGAAFPVEGAVGRIEWLQETPGRIEMAVEVDRPSVVLVRDAYAPGWTAAVDGTPVPVLRADGRHRAVPIGTGRSRVRMIYRPPGLATGVALAGVSLALAGVFAFGRRRAA